MLSVLACAVIAQSGGAAYNPSGPKLAVKMESGGTFVITTDLKAAPKTVARIAALVQQKFYDKQRFHRVENWVVQWGDPNSKDGDLRREGIGSGGSGKALPFEGSTVTFAKGVVGIASTGAKRGGDSQLFILTRDAAHLDGNYAVLGKVTQGMEVVEKLKWGDRIATMTLQGPPMPSSKGR